MLDHVSEQLRPAQRGASASSYDRPGDAPSGLTPREFSHRVLRTFIDHDEWRLGQSAFNVALSYWPDTVRDLVGSEADPFYKDGNLGRFMHVLFPDEVDERGEVRR